LTAVDALNGEHLIGAVSSSVHQRLKVGGMAAGVKGTPMPHRVPITVVMGKPFKVPHIADPTQEQVQPFAMFMHLLLRFQNLSITCIGCSASAYAGV
jgi:Diacylglycerol acyltransferase